MKWWCHATWSLALWENTEDNNEYGSIYKVINKHPVNEC